ncbi:MAG: 16S rRNA (uracil(1498)-N(3))-methyltransferase, partial [Casimicrobiaceae bacterium]|nr:16S rRNA (uracil(1498)-N(3))-methyltransferase [Casimicrobiaceae bacterium]
PLTLAVGPEGGFSPGELAALRARAQVRLTLGPTVLRAETAAVAGLALVSAPPHPNSLPQGEGAKLTLSLGERVAQSAG